MSVVPDMPYQLEGRYRRTKYSMVSKAADKSSNNVSAVTLPLPILSDYVSMFSDISLGTFSRAVSVQ